MKETVTSTTTTSTMNMSAMNASMMSSQSMKMSSSNEITAADLNTLNLNINDENKMSSRNYGSNGTEYTSITEVRERPSNATYVKPQYI